MPDAEPLPAWVSHMAPEEPAVARPRAASRLGDDEPAASSPARPDAEAQIRFGLHVHKLLQLLPGSPETARGAALVRYLDRAQDLDEAARAHARIRVEAVLAHPELKAVFGPGSRAEQAICGVVEGVAITGQIDRLAVLPDRVLIVDYKTNRRPPVRASEAPIAYLRQIAAYRQLLRRIYPGRQVHAALVWTETGAVTWLETGLLDAHMPGGCRCFGMRSGGRLTPRMIHPRLRAGSTSEAADGDFADV